MENMHNRLLDLYQNARLKLYPQDQIVIYAGDPPIEVYIIKTGYIKVYDIDGDGNEKILSIVKPGDIMPYAFYSGSDVPNRWFYQSISDAEVYVMNRDELLAKLKNDAEIMFALVNNFSLEVHELLTRISSLGKSNIHDKILALMRYLVVCIGKDNTKRWWRVPFPVNQQLLADITGMTRESCSTAIKELVNDELIRQPKINVLEINTVNLMKGN